MPMAGVDVLAEQAGGGPRLVDDVADERVDALRMPRAERSTNRCGQVVVAEEAGADGVGDVVVEVGDGVGEARDLAFERRRQVRFASTITPSRDFE